LLIKVGIVIGVDGLVTVAPYPLRHWAKDWAIIAIVAIIVVQ
jgi:hypothetical protein